MMFQREVMTTISRAGPFAYRDEIPSTTLTAQYKFYFNWVGDAIFPQIINTGWSVWCSSSPPGPRAPRPTLRRQLALPAAPAYPQHAHPQWHGGDGGDEPRGEGGDGADSDGGYQPEDIDALVAALKKKRVKRRKWGRRK